MTAATDHTGIEREKFIIRHRGSMRARRRTNMVIFLGPAIFLTLMFYFLPVIVDILLAFADTNRSLSRIDFPTTKQFEKIFRGDPRLPSVLLTTFIYVFGTLAFFNVTFGLLLALATTAVEKISGSFFRGVWLLPRMSPSVVYILLWLWAVDPAESGLLNQVLMNVFQFAEPTDMKSNMPMLLIIIVNGFIGASMGMIIFTSAIRAIPEHLFHAARVDGAGSLATVWHITLPALKWPISFITIYQTLSLMVSFEYIWLLTQGGPFFDTTVYSLHVYKRSFFNGQYAYGAALALFMIVIGVVVALLGWRFFDMKALMEEPRIEVQ